MHGGKERKRMSVSLKKTHKSCGNSRELVNVPKESRCTQEILVLAERRTTISLDIVVMPALFPFPRGH